MLFCPHRHPIIVVAKFNPKSYCWICCMEFVKTILFSSRITAVKMRTGGFHCLWLLKGPWRGYLGDRLKIILNSISVCYLLKINANDNHLTGGHHHHLLQKPVELPFPARPCSNHQNWNGSIFLMCISFSLIVYQLLLYLGKISRITEFFFFFLVCFF